MVATMSNDHNLQHFVDAQKGSYERAFAEICNGQETQPLDVVYFSAGSRPGV